MSWTALALTSDWETDGGSPVARVRPLSTPANTAQLEGYLVYAGSGTANVPITSGALPSGTFDPNGVHFIGANWYNINGAHVGTCQLLIGPSEALTVLAVPQGGYALYFNELYSVA